MKGLRARSEALSSTGSATHILAGGYLQHAQNTKLGAPPDSSQAHRFLEGLARKEAFSFQTFNDRKGKGQEDYDPLAKTFHGTLTSGLAEQLAQLNARGAGIFVMVNAGDLKGRKTENVVRVRALFIDTDGAPFPTSLPLQPHLFVKSSPGRWHLYWLVEGVLLEHFTTLQRALAEHYGTDPSVCDLPRVMRLPGFRHCKSEPVLVQLLEAEDRPPYAYAEVLETWPCLTEALVTAKRRKEEAEAAKRLALEMRSRVLIVPSGATQRAQRLLQAHHDAVASASEGQRHETLKRHARALGGYVGGGAISKSAASEALSAAAEVCGLPVREASDLIFWGLDRGANDPLYLDAFGEKQGFSERCCSPNQSPWLSQSCNYANTKSTQKGGRWNGGKSEWR